MNHSIPVKTKLFWFRLAESLALSLNPAVPSTINLLKIFQRMEAMEERITVLEVRDINLRKNAQKTIEALEALKIKNSI